VWCADLHDADDVFDTARTSLDCYSSSDERVIQPPSLWVRCAAEEVVRCSVRKEMPALLTKMAREQK
jgi:hypothetical protein